MKMPTLATYWTLPSPEQQHIHDTHVKPCGFDLLDVSTIVFELSYATDEPVSCSYYDGERAYVDIETLDELIAEIRARIPLSAWFRVALCKRHADRELGVGWYEREKGDGVFLPWREEARYAHGLCEAINERWQKMQEGD